MHQKKQMDIAIIRGASGDEVTASSIAREAAEWLIQSGKALWEPRDIAPEFFLPHIDAGELYLASIQGKPVGMMILQSEDTLVWPDVPAGTSAFLHRLAVRRSAAGKGVSMALINHAKAVAIDAGRKYLRLDCVTRPRLCAFYESAGFIRQGIKQIRIDARVFQIARYEMRLENLDEARE